MVKMVMVMLPKMGLMGSSNIIIRAKSQGITMKKMLVLTMRPMHTAQRSI